MKINQNKLFVIGGTLIFLALVIYIASRIENGEQPTAETAGNIPHNAKLTATTSTSSEVINTKYALENVEGLKGARVEVLGASPISADDQVMTYEGKVADNTAEPGSADAPKRTLAVSKGDLPAGTIMIDGSAAGFSPKAVTVQSGQPATISLTATDDQVHVLRFADQQLKAISLAVMPGETKAITFQAPAAGSYPFFCEVPGHKDRGETGVMIVD